MTTTLITGANKGLGFETARRLIDLGHTVYLGARDVGRGQAAADALGARFLPLDVTDDASVTAAAATIMKEVGHLDVLVNNAGIAGTSTSPELATGADALAVFDTNVASVVRTTAAFLPLLRGSASPVIVNVSSGLGSFDRTHDTERIESQVPALVYAASKSAVTMLTTQYAKALPGFRINAADPGYTATDLNGRSGYQTVQEGTDAIVELATLGTDGPTGTFRDRAGTVEW